jgi:hypothetical protein
MKICSLILLSQQVRNTIYKVQKKMLEIIRGPNRKIGNTAPLFKKALGHIIALLAPLTLNTGKRGGGGWWLITRTL